MEINNHNKKRPYYFIRLLPNTPSPSSCSKFSPGHSFMGSFICSGFLLVRNFCLGIMSPTSSQRLSPKASYTSISTLFIISLFSISTLYYLLLSLPKNHCQSHSLVIEQEQGVENHGNEYGFQPEEGRQRRKVFNASRSRGLLTPGTKAFCSILKNLHSCQSALPLSLCPSLLTF